MNRGGNMGKQIYFTKEELQYIALVFSNIDALEDENEERLVSSISRKVNQASKEST